MAREYIGKIMGNKKVRVETLKKEEECRALLGNCPDSAAILGANGRILFLNSKCAGLFRKSPPQMLNKLIWDFMPVKGALFTIANLKKAIKTSTGQHLSGYANFGDTTKCYLTTLTPMKKHAGGEGAVMAISVDITGLKNVEERLHASEQKYKNLFNEMSEGFTLHRIITDKKGKPIDYFFNDANPAFESITGLKRVQIIGETARKILPKIEKTLIEKYGKIALSGKPARFVAYSHEAGKWFQINAFSPQKGFFATLFTDITDLKKAEEALETKDRYLNTIIRNAPLALFALDKQGIITLLEGRGLAGLDMLPGELVGKSIFDVYKNMNSKHPEILGNIRLALDGNARHYELKVGDLWYESFCEPVFGENRKVIGLIGIYNNITGRKKSEEMMLAIKKDIGE